MTCFLCGRDIDPLSMSLHHQVELAISEGLLAESRGSATVDIDLEAMRQLELFDKSKNGPAADHSPAVGPVDEELF